VKRGLLMGVAWSLEGSGLSLYGLLRVTVTGKQLRGARGGGLTHGCGLVS